MLILLGSKHSLVQQEIKLLIIGWSLNILMICRFPFSKLSIICLITPMKQENRPHASFNLLFQLIRISSLFNLELKVMISGKNVNKDKRSGRYLKTEVQYEANYKIRRLMVLLLSCIWNRRPFRLNEQYILFTDFINIYYLLHSLLSCIL